MERDSQPLTRAEGLEQIVDELDDKVAREHEEQGVPGNRAERRREPRVSGPRSEPPE